MDLNSLFARKKFQWLLLIIVVCVGVILGVVVVRSEVVEVVVIRIGVVVVVVD